MSSQDKDKAARAYLAKMLEAAEEIGPVPVSRVDKVDEWTTTDGDVIIEYEHYRDYPLALRFPGIVPGQSTEMRGWPCPRCGSKDTSVWGVTTVPDSGTFECRHCAAVGRWSFYCRRRVPIHLDEECDCPIDPGLFGENPAGMTDDVQ